MTEKLTQRKKKEFLAAAPLFAEVEQVAIADIAKIAEEKIFSKGEILTEEGDQGDRMYVITSGEVLVSKINDSGKSVDLAVRGKGDHLGEMAILGEIPRTATLRASSEVHALVVTKEDFEKLLITHTKISLGVIRELIRRLDESDKRIQGQSGK